MKITKLAFLVALSSALVACGGGSGSSNNTSSKNASSLSSSQAVSSLANSSESSAAESSLSSAESSIAASASSESSAASSESSESSSDASSASSESSSDASSSEASSSAGSGWSVYNGSLHPTAAGAVTLADGSAAAFELGGTADVNYFTSTGTGTLVLDSSAVAANSNHLTLRNVIRNDGVYPKYLTMIAGISGHTDNLRVIELEMAMADEGVAGSRLKALLRNDGSNKGVQLEQANGGTSVNSYGLDMSGFRIYHLAVTLTDATTGSVKVYADGSQQTLPNLSLDDVGMRATSTAGDNFIRIGDGGGSAYKATVDWLIWTDAGAFDPAEVSGLLPADLGCVYNYGESDDLATCVNPPVSSSSSSAASQSSVSSASSADTSSASSADGSHSSANSSTSSVEGSSSSGDSQSSSSAGSPGEGPSGGTLSCPAANTVQGFASLDGGTTGGAGGTYVVAKTGADIVAALASKKNNTAPLTIYINGTITPANSGVVQFDVKDMENVSIIGVGNAALFDGIGINIVRADNIIVRNITMRYVRIGQKDHISIDGNSSNVWIDHNRFYNSLTVGKDYYDELVSGKGNVDKITISYNHFHDSWKTSLWGSGDGNSGHRRVSFIANRWEDVNSRLPLFRFGEAHMLNNYYSNARESGINSRMGAQVRVENNYFENSKNILISMDSSAVGFWNPSGNILKNIEWAPFPSGNCTTSKQCVWGGQPGTNQTDGEFEAFSNQPANPVTISAYEPPYASGYVIERTLTGEDIKTHVLDNAGSNVLTRDCLGIPADIIEGETGGGTTPGGDGGVGSGEGDTGGSEPVPAEGGWNLELMKMGSSTAAVSGSVSASDETSATFSIAGGKFESSKEAFVFINKRVNGDFVFTANLSAWNTPTRSGSDQGSVGVMLCVECESGGAMSASARIGLRDNGILHAQRLSATASLNKTSVGTALVPSDQLYLRVARTGNSYTLSYSVDGGETYTQARTGTFTDILPDDVVVGLYASQGNNDANGFTFTDILLEANGEE